MTSNAIVQKLWNYCNILRDDGLSYQDYIEQLTFLLFLKMADERQKLFPERVILIPRALDWQSLERLDGDDLDQHYRHILVELGKKPGMLGTIFRKAQNRIQDPAKLKRLISDLIGRETWTTLGVDVKGDAYEGLLEKERCRREGRRWPVLHAARADSGHCGRDAPRAGPAYSRPSLRHRRLGRT
jgi:type I restriction enzyme M protein